jgi:hypothetical protein
MDTIYLVNADYGYEGQAAVRAFATEDEATAFCARCNAWAQTEPKGYRTPEYAALKAEWKRAHPAPTNTAADYFEVSAVPFGNATES